MEIKIREYRLTPNDVCPDRFDLRKDVISRKKAKDFQTEEEREEYENNYILANGMTVPSCILLIIGYELQKDPSVVSLKEYLIAYKEIKKEIIDNINEIIKINKDELTSD